MSVHADIMTKASQNSWLSSQRELLSVYSLSAELSLAIVRIYVCLVRLSHLFIC